MVGLVLVSHSAAVARGVAELAREMAGPDVVIAEAGGAGERLGTDATLVADGIERAMGGAGDGVIVLMDLGSAVLSAELALELVGADVAAQVVLCEAPLVEGAVSAAIAAGQGRSLTEVVAEARAALQPKAVHLGISADRVAGAVPAGGHQIRFVVKNRLGLHARPAARLVTAMGRFDAQVRVANVTAGRGPADARSLNGVAILGVRQGDEVVVTARGPDAVAALAEVQALADRDFGETDRPPMEALPAAVEAGAFAGTPASPGVAVGPVRYLARTPPVVAVAERAVGDPAAEGEALAGARAAARAELAALRASVASRAGEDEAAIFDVHLLLLDDEAVLEPARRCIDEGRSAAFAWDAAVRAAVTAFAGLDDPYQRARGDDVAEVGRRVLGHLTGSTGGALDGPGILVAPDLSPGDVAAIDPALLLGVATEGGGPLGHGAILARALGIPAVVGLGPAVLRLPEGTVVVLDGGKGTLRVDPDGEPAVRGPAARPALRSKSGPAHTADGVQVVVAANVGSFDDVERALAAGADGIGLLRTEFLFAGGAALPTEDEQFDAYRRIAVALDGRPLVIRTLDAGADKPVPGLVTGADAGETNPALGVRGLRLGLAHADVLATQLRAILRVAADHPVRVLFPMVTTVDEVVAAQAILAEARRDLGLEGTRLPVGVMVEVPAAALDADRFAPEVDFFSIGTNDLTQYVLAADRTNAGVAGLADGLHPAVLRLIGEVVRVGRPVAVCGELAADPSAVPVLLGLGVRELSVRPSAVAATAEAVRAFRARPASRTLDRITWSRVVIAPAVMALVLGRAFGAAAVLFAAAALTDLVDGYLARRWRQTSDYGAFLDTTADKVLVGGVLIALVAVGRASPWLATVIVARELAVLALRGLVARSGTVMAPSLAGKAKANVQYVAIVLAMVKPPWRVDEVAMAAAAVLAVVSGCGYFRRFGTSAAKRRNETSRGATTSTGTR